ncbi:hypothetical protein [Candidatus Chloroploca asiatica]|uniref:Uncharacterized protein n=1 Tax=Candidatus Chloroploca asiatica TaxID=1506545 RepID=A0A2H3L9Z4_9CHLR|nr:hypothetical protein [Candidatus Chloroploca asiatica]PDW00225.1 hypothetical protein A9Q02_10415 [Candidatus Chloroploca asiatica]
MKAQIAAAEHQRCSARAVGADSDLPGAPPTEPDGTEDALSVAFLPTVPDEAAQQRLLALQTVLDDLHVSGREVYWRCHTKVSASTFSGARLEQALGMPATVDGAAGIATERMLGCQGASLCISMRRTHVMANFPHVRIGDDFVAS